MKKAASFLGSHVASLLLTGLAMYGVANIYLVFPVTFIDVMMLYAWILTLLILPIQTGVQVWSALSLKPTPLLLIYYFQHDASRNLPHQFLDPVYSRIGLATVVLLLLGGVVAWPSYAVYGALLLVVRTAMGFHLFGLEFLALFVRAMAVGVSALFVGYFAIASFAILLLQWRSR